MHDVRIDEAFATFKACLHDECLSLDFANNIISILSGDVVKHRISASDGLMFSFMLILNYHKMDARVVKEMIEQVKIYEKNLEHYMRTIVALLLNELKKYMGEAEGGGL